MPVQYSGDFHKSNRQFNIQNQTGIIEINLIFEIQQKFSHFYHPWILVSNHEKNCTESQEYNLNNSDNPNIIHTKSRTILFKLTNFDDENMSYLVV